MSPVAVYLRLFHVQLRSQLQYRVSFTLSLLGTLLFTALDFAAILILFGRIDTLAGWSAAEVALLYSAAATSYAVADIALGSLDRLPGMVRDGSFDVLLVRPRSAFIQVLATDFMVRRAGRLIQALAVLVVVVGVVLPVPWSWPDLALLVLAILSGAVILGAVWVVAAASVFWLVDAGEFVNAFTSGALFLAQHPVPVYTAWLRQLVLFVVPIGFVIYLPATYLLDKSAPVDPSAFLRFASPAVAAIAAGVAVVVVVVWRAAVRRYRRSASRPRSPT
jgi:ABC-2 type transport system permease protein